MLAHPSQPRSQSAPLIGGLTVLAIAAIAMALPPSPIATTNGTEGLGILQSTGLFSAGMAEQNAANDFGFLALDITEAHPDRRALWQRELDVVARRRYAVYGWIDTRRAVSAGVGRDLSLVGSLNLTGVYLYGPDAPARAHEIRAANSDLKVIAVAPAGSKVDVSAKGVGIAVDLKTWLASKGEIANPVLIADQLSEADKHKAVEHARALAGKDGKPRLLIASIAID